MAAPKGHLPYNIHGEGGRPRRYSSEDIEKLADDFIVWLKKPKNIWFKDFCLERDIDPDFMKEWAKENERFNGIYKLAKHWQESKLLNGSLTKTLNSSTAEFVLINHHGYTNKQQITGDLSNPLTFLLEIADGRSKELVEE